MEQAPNKTAVMEKFRQEREKEVNLAHEREQIHRQALRERKQAEMSNGVEEEEIPLADPDKMA